MTTKVKYNPNSKEWQVWVMIDDQIYPAGDYPTQADAERIAADLERVPSNAS